MKIDFSSTEKCVNGFIPDKIINVDKYDHQSVSEIIDYTFNQTMSHIDMVHALSKYRHILKPHGTIIIRSIHPIGKVTRALAYADFTDVMRFDKDTVRAQNQCYITSRFKTSSDTPKILVESTARIFGDQLLAYPLTSLFKTRYPNCTLYYGCDATEKPLFRLANTIDHVVDRLIEKDDYKYDIILRAPFDVDEKWNPVNYFGDLDSPAGWYVCCQKNPLGFNWPEKIDLPDLLKGPAKKVAIFLSSKRSVSTLPYEIFGYDQYQEIVDLLPEIHFFTFYSGAESGNQLVGENVTNLGRLYAYQELQLFEQMDLLVSISTSVSAMIGPIAAVPQVVIHTCEANGTPTWIAPDMCVLPPLRMRHLCGGSEITYIKPFAGAKTKEWNFNSYWTKKTEKRKIRMTHGIEPETIIFEIKRMLETNVGHEYGNNYRKMCERCKLEKCMHTFKEMI